MRNRKESKNKPPKIKIGDLVDYHSIIGGPVTKSRKKVWAGPQWMGGSWAVWLEGISGCVAVAACTPATDEGAIESMKHAHEVATRMLCRVLEAAEDFAGAAERLLKDYKDARIELTSQMLAAPLAAIKKFHTDVWRNDCAIRSAMELELDAAWRVRLADGAPAGVVKRMLDGLDPEQLERVMTQLNERKEARKANGA